MSRLLIGESRAMNRISEYVERVADTGLSVLITGETGVGKEVVARMLHDASPRSDRPFVQVNCAALPEPLLESELFGYEKGAFTGAQRRRRGKFQMAHQGVLFLDEIGEMPLALQSKILHVLQGGQFSPLGAEDDIHSDAWVICATNQNLESRIREGAFREDLFYRLNIIKIHVPPLRERVEDIPLLVRHFIARYQEQFPERRVTPPDAAIMTQLCRYAWPGNVRQLQNTIQKQFVMNNWHQVMAELPSSTGGWRSPEGQKIGHLRHAAAPGASDSGTAVSSEKNPDRFSGRNGGPALPSPLPLFFNPETFQDRDISLKEIRNAVVHQVEKEVIEWVLIQTGWNRLRASKILKISYKTMLTKITALGLEPPDA